MYLFIHLLAKRYSLSLLINLLMYFRFSRHSPPSHPHKSNPLFLYASVWVTAPQRFGLSTRLLHPTPAPLLFIYPIFTHGPSPPASPVHPPHPTLHARTTRRILTGNDATNIYLLIYLPAQERSPRGEMGSDIPPSLKTACSELAPVRPPSFDLKLRSIFYVFIEMRTYVFIYLCVYLRFIHLYLFPDPVLGGQLWGMKTVVYKSHAHTNLCKPYSGTKGCTTSQCESSSTVLGVNSPDPQAGCVLLAVCGVTTVV